MSRLADLLKTENEEEQVQVVEKLLEAASTPVVGMMVVLDTRSGKCDLSLNGTYSFDEIYALLDIARREVNRRERDAIIQQQEQTAQQ